MLVPISMYVNWSLPVVIGIRAPLRSWEPGRARRSSAFTLNEYGKFDTFFSPSYSVKTTCKAKNTTTFFFIRSFLSTWTSSSNSLIGFTAFQRLYGQLSQAQLCDLQRLDLKRRVI